jgi:hypothetical protein
MAKPISLPRWAETVAGVPDTNITEPNEGKKDTGYVTGGDIPTSGGLNWWMRLVYKWIQWVDAAASIATAGVLVVRDAAGRARFADPSDVADADTLGARDTAISTHNAVTNPHSATALATASRLVLRDAAGRAAFASPAAAQDAATKGYVDAFFPAKAWTALTVAANWTPFSGGLVPGYWLDSAGVVHIRGYATAGTGAPALVLTGLPTELKPSGDRFFAVIDDTAKAAVAAKVLGTTGEIQMLNSPTAGHSYSFDLSFVATF